MEQARNVGTCNYPGCSFYVYDRQKMRCWKHSWSEYVKPQSKDDYISDLHTDRDRLLSALRELERSVSAKFAHQLHAPLGIAPEWHDLYSSIVAARKVLDP